jgi:hypothetical protein
MSDWGIGFLLRFARPEIDIGFVPNLEIPLSHLLNAVSRYQMARELENQLVPLPRIARRGHVGVIPERVRARSHRHFFRHETEFDKGANSNLQQTIVDQVNSREIQDQVSRSVLPAIDTRLVFKDSMKPDILYVHDFPQRSEIMPPIFTQGDRSMAGAKHMFPKMRKSGRRTLGIDSDLLFHKWGDLKTPEKGRNQFPKVLTNSFCSCPKLDWKKSEISNGNAIPINRASFEIPILG